MAGLIRVDLHCHSSASDGDLSPEDLARELVGAGVEFAALTDHETVAGQGRFRTELESRGVRCVSGAEIQVRSDWGPLHVLAYGFDERDPNLRRVLRRLRSPLLSYARDVGGRIWTRLARRRDGRESRDGNSDSLLALDGRLDGRSDDRLDEMPVGRIDAEISAAGAFSLIHRTGGRVFLAHPLTGTGGLTWLAEALPTLRDGGLDGIEALYKPYPTEARQALRDLAERHDMLVSAGSDFHGRSFPNGVSLGLDVAEADLDRFLGAVGQTR